MLVGEWGFFQVVNHGIDDDLVASTSLQMQRFFAQPASVKESVLRTRENPWGYYNNELTKNQRDRKEVFDYTIDAEDPIYGAVNRWPDMGDEFRDVMRAYLLSCEKLSLTLLQAFCVGLDLPPDFMRDDFANRHTGFVRLNYYPVRDPLADSTQPHQPDADLGVHHHTDAGALTVLLQDTVGGLQVYRDGFWHDIPPVDGAMVINTGDMMQVWSNDLYQAAIHRVLAMQTRDRYSIPFFFNPAATTTVSPLPTAVRPDRPARYSDVKWSDFRSKRTDGDYADLRARGTDISIPHLGHTSHSNSATGYKNMKKPMALALIATTAATSAVFAQVDEHANTFVAEHVFDLEFANDPRISPDGTQIVYERRSYDIMKDNSLSNLWTLAADGSRHRPLVSGTDSASSPRWSPDGDRIAYVQATSSGTGMMVRWMDSGQTALLANLQHSPEDVTWSPDGRWLAFVAAVPAETKPIASPRQKPEGAEWSDPVKVIDAARYRRDGARVP